MAANLNNFQRWNSKKQVKKNMQASRCNKVTESNSKFAQEEKLAFVTGTKKKKTITVEKWRKPAPRCPVMY
jgi:hypothetical protein